MIFTPEKISVLRENQIFVFGSSARGRHGKGAALTARERFGAINGQGEGLQGRSYAIPTKDGRMKTLGLNQINIHVYRFICFAYDNPSLTFLVTKIGCGLAGLEIFQIAPMFKMTEDLFKGKRDTNVILPKEFYSHNHLYDLK